MSEIPECMILQSNNRPLVTFALFAYNQEKYIGEAVKAALAQTYEPLEIIFSDDNSTDRTFDIITDLLASYGGPHSIRLNRNGVNMGISPHVRFIHKISKGDYIVHAAGDDISHPNRTSIIVNAFLYNDCNPSVVMSNYTLIDECGGELGFGNDVTITKVFKKNSSCPIDISGPGGGPTLALSRELVNSFEDPNIEIFMEDNLLVSRAHLINGVLYIPDFLVQYRVNHGSISNPFGKKYASNMELVSFRAKWIQQRIYGVMQFYEDANKIGFLRSKNKILFHEIEKYLLRLNMLKSVLEGPFLNSTLSLIKELTKIERSSFKVYLPIPYLTSLKYYVLRWFPFYRSTKNLFFKIFKCWPSGQ